MIRFVPKRVIFEPEALEFPLGKEIYQHFRGNPDVEIRQTPTHNRVSGIPGKTPLEGYREAKQTLVVGIKRGMNFQTCKPSAHYQLPLVTSCPGMCEYCYLQTTLGKKPYVRVYINVDEILGQAQKYMATAQPEITIFEGAATSDPIPVEYLTGSLAKTIEFFGKQEFGRFRFVTKFTDIDSLLGLNHNGHTRFRFSINWENIVKKYEHRTPIVEERLQAAKKVADAGYPLGFIIAPIFLDEGWEAGYSHLLETVQKVFAGGLPEGTTFEFITHRFTQRAKTNILALFPATTLPMQEEERKFKFGQFGYGKYIYQPDEFKDLKDFLRQQMELTFPQAQTEYLV
jgi:spore photoproduct lyase